MAEGVWSKGAQTWRLVTMVWGHDLRPPSRLPSATAAAGLLSSVRGRHGLRARAPAGHASASQRRARHARPRPPVADLARFRRFRR